MEIHPITPEDVHDLFRAVSTAFGDEPKEDRIADEHLTMEYDRMLGVVDGNEFVAGAGAYSFELTLPGLTYVPAAGVTWVGVLPTHRRQGILTSMMRHQLDDIAARGESVAILTASEAVIYGRFGYGLASQYVSATVPRRRSAYAVESHAEGRIRYLRVEEAGKILPPIFDEWRRSRVGSVNRNEGFWAHRLLDREHNRNGASAAWWVLHEDASGRPDGYAVYRVREGRDGEENVVVVPEVISTDPEVEAALLQFLFDQDLQKAVELQVRPLDDPLRWRLRDSRAYRTTFQVDFLWLRVVDTAAALSSRSYATEGTLVFEVVDDFRPDGDAAGRFRLDGSPAGAICTRAGKGDEPAIRLSVIALGNAFLGDVSFSTLAAAGKVSGDRDALRLADAMFRPEHSPFCNTEF